MNKREEKLLKQLKAFSPEEEVIISNFKTKGTVCDWKCLKCGYEFKAIPNTILKRHQHHICTKCYPPLRYRKRDMDLREKIIKEAGKRKNIKLLDIYIDRHTRVKFQCLDCGGIDDFKWEDRRKLECTKCKSNRHNMDINSFQYLLNEKYDNRFTVLEYTNSTTKTLIKCNECGFIFKTHPTTLLRLQGKRCPKCQSGKSRAELFISKFLTKSKVLFEDEKHFPGMEKGTRFDFFLPKYNLIIEYMGEQHYTYTSHFHKKYEDFKEQQRRDAEKKDYALRNGYNYLSISYIYQNRLREILSNLIGSTTIPRGSRGKCLEVEDFLNKEEDIV